MSIRLRLAALLLLAAPASAADLSLDVLGVDTGTCPSTAPCATLAYALTQAAPAGGDVIHVGNGTFVGCVTIDRGVTIEGTGTTVIDGGGADAVMRWRCADALTLRGLEIRGGYNLDTLEAGGFDMDQGTVLIEDCVFTGNDGNGPTAIRHHAGTMTIRRTTVRDNVSTSTFFTGAAIQTDDGDFLMEDCRVTGNQAYAGTGLWVGRTSNATLRRSTISGTVTGNVTQGSGIHCGGRLTAEDCEITDNGPYGGIYVAEASAEVTLERCTIARSVGVGVQNQDGLLVMRDCLVTGNSSWSFGGGMINVATTRVERCAFIDNEAGHDGGAIWSNGGSTGPGNLTLVNCTLSGNRAGQQGGGIVVDRTGTLRIHACTITGNSAALEGGAIAQQDPDVLVVLTGSIVAGNTSATGSAAILGTWTSEGYNIIDDATGWTATGATATDLVGVDPLLAPLADNGGALPTHALLAGSPAIDSGDPAGCLDPDGLPLTDDGIGALRPTDGDCDGTSICDRGALEWIACVVRTLTLYESAQPRSVVDPGNAVGTPVASPHGHGPAPGSLLFYQIDDGTGWPALVFVERGGPGLMFTW